MFNIQMARFPEDGANNIETLWDTNTISMYVY